jgi:hypothetical protein
MERTIILIVSLALLLISTSGLIWLFLHMVSHY